MRILVIPYILYYKVYNSNCYLIDHVHCIDASMPEHEALPSHKMCLQIEAIIFIYSGEDLTLSIRLCPT